jgi:hypothetical protein
MPPGGFCVAKAKHQVTKIKETRRESNDKQQA